MNNNINKRFNTNTSNAETRQSTAGTIGQSVSMDMVDLKLGLSLSSKKDDDNVLSNDTLHYDDNTCSEDARIIKELSDDSLSTNDDDTIMSERKEHQTKLLNGVKQLRIQLYKATALSIKHIDNETLDPRASALRRQLKLVKENYELLSDESAIKSTATSESSLVPSDTSFMQWKFEDVLESREISVEANWKGTIKCKMPTCMASRICGLIEKYRNISWDQFKSKLMVKYSPSEVEEKKAPLNKLKNSNNNGVAKQYHGFSKKLIRRGGKFHKKEKENNGGETPNFFDCGFTPFTYAHKTVCKKKPKNIAQGKKKKSIVPTPSRNADTITDSSDDESDQHFAAATIAPRKKGKEVSQMDTDSECKHFDSDYFKKIPNNNINTNGHLYLPVILETNAGIKVKTYIIKLAQNNSVVDCKGQTEEELIINYGSKFFRSKFEVFDLFNNAHCAFGMVLLYNIEHNSYKANDDPYGSEKKRKIMMDELKPFIDANTSISPKAYCSIPDNKTTTLPTKKDTPFLNTYRRKLPFAEALRSVIQKQIEK
ncbi:hypothetical protein INT46_001511 [Mucor plumbeus]|uniref:Uncharacterized protein n=1 Tax=Mucor plumbeus TaxID=97098 RepID=A0A8H7QNH5_9FUNG|nr:hypothetical protein INT46_001511 [Mucor plumbeus]